MSLHPFIVSNITFRAPFVLVRVWDSFPGSLDVPIGSYCIERCLIRKGLALEMYISSYYNEDWLNEGIVVNTELKRYNLFA